MKYTGEMLIPEKARGSTIYAEHYARYLFAAQFVKGRIVLDVASGAGYGTKLLADRGAKSVYGIDISNEAIKYAKKTYGGKNVTFIRGDAYAVPLGDHAVDMVVSLETIEHLSDPKKFLKEAKRVLKPQGILIVSTPNAPVYNKISKNPFHLTELTINKFSDALGRFFKNVDLYSQINWITSAISEQKFTEADSLSKPADIKFYKLAGKDLEDCLFVMAICGDGQIPKFDGGFGAVVSGEDIYNLQVTMVENRETIKKLGKRLSTTERELKKAKDSLDGIYRSKAWRAIVVYRSIVELLRRVFSKNNA